MTQRTLFFGAFGAPPHSPPVAGHSPAGRFLGFRAFAVPPVWLVSSATKSARQLSTRRAPEGVGKLLGVYALCAGMTLSALPAAAGTPKSLPKKVITKQLVKQGRLRVVRSVDGRAAQLTDAKGKRWLLTGALRPELLRLHNHRLKVWATPGKKKMMRATLRVRRYVVTVISGRKPLIGRLQKMASAPSHLGIKQKNGLVPIRGSKPFIKRLRRRLGCKIWIVGDMADSTLKAFKFGWLRCQKRQPIQPKSKAH